MFGMKHLLILPGNSSKNKAWGELMLLNYGGGYDSAFILEYEHWQTGAELINFTLEESRLSEHVATLSPGMEITVCAKSAGSILTFLAVESGVLKPVECFFFGIPFDYAAGDVFRVNWTAVESFSVSATAFHNENDPTAAYEFTKQILETKAPHIKLITTPDANHAYDRTDIYDEYLNQSLL